MIVLDLDKNKPAMVLNLTKDLPSVKKLKGILAWDPHPLHGASVTEGYDLDIFLFGTNAAGKVFRQEDIMFFGNKAHTSGGYSVPVDNQTGVGEDDEYFMADLDRIPADIGELHVWVFIHEAAKRGQNFGMVANTRFDIKDVEAPKKADGSDADAVVRYQVTQQFSNETCLHVAIIARSGSGWEIRPVGTGGVFDPNEVLAAYLS